MIKIIALAGNKYAHLNSNLIPVKKYIKILSYVYCNNENDKLSISLNDANSIIFKEFVNKIKEIEKNIKEESTWGYTLEGETLIQESRLIEINQNLVIFPKYRAPYNLNLEDVEI